MKKRIREKKEYQTFTKRNVKKFIGKKVKFYQFPWTDNPTVGIGIIVGYDTAGAAIVKVISGFIGWKRITNGKEVVDKSKFFLPIDDENDELWFIGRAHIIKVYE